MKKPRRRPTGATGWIRKRSTRSKKKKLLPVAELDRGFIRPSYPSQVIVSYFQAGQICSYIAQKWGYGKLLEMMHSFGELKTTPEVIQEDSDMTPEEFDKQFLAWLEAQTKVTGGAFRGMEEAVEGDVRRSEGQEITTSDREGHARFATGIPITSRPAASTRCWRTPTGQGRQEGRACCNWRNTAPSADAVPR